MTSMNYFDADWKNFKDFFKRKKVLGNASNDKIQQSSSSSILYTVTVLSVYEAQHWQQKQEICILNSLIICNNARKTVTL